MSSTVFSEAERERLRRRHYNATIVSWRQMHDELVVFRIRPDAGIRPFVAGQYAVLGCGFWEPRAPGCQDEWDITRKLERVVKRAYSVSSPILDQDGSVVKLCDAGFLEFYVALVRSADRPPALTPRLFALKEGDRLFCGPRFHGHYTLGATPRDAQILLAGTGTGEAPHNAMLTQLLSTGHRGRIATITCVRTKKDLGYLDTHRRVETLHDNYRYIALTTREPENLDSSLPGFVGKRYLQDYVTTDDFAAETGLDLNPETTHVFLCGNPDMIGAPLHSHRTEQRFPQANGMVETLERLGFEVDQPHEPGNIHFEKYW